MRRQYSESGLDGNLSNIVNLQKFTYGLASKAAGEQEVLREITRFIFHAFGFKEIAVALRSPTDGKYRYEAFLGMTRDAEQGYKAIIYDHSHVFNDDIYPGIRLSKHTELALAELEAYVEGEEGSYNRPAMLKEKRASADQMLDSDYYTAYLLGPGDDTFGWIELSGHKSGKFPPMGIIRQLELFSSVISLILYQWRAGVKKASPGPRPK